MIHLLILYIHFVLGSLVYTIHNTVIPSPFWSLLQISHSLHFCFLLYIYTEKCMFMMKYCHFILVLWSLINVSILQVSSNCFPEERQALLDFKASLNETKYLDLILPSWIDHHHYHEEGYNNDHPIATDCCNWEGVNCSDATGRIVELHLSDLGRHIRWSVDDFLPHWFLNISILFPLENLQSLDLSFNPFGRHAPCERLDGFKNLESLDLKGIKLDNVTLQCLTTISFLKNLSLEIYPMTSSEEPCIPLVGFKNLESLNLDWSYLENTTLQCLSTISSLKNLSLSATGITSLEGCELLANFKNLKSLNLDWNHLDNSTIQCVTTNSSLKYLSLAKNHINGLFPFKEINRLKQLEYLDLSSNYFDGSLSFEDLKLPHLELLNLGNNNMQKVSSIEVMTSLKSLSLRNNNMTCSSILEGICNLKNLTELDLSFNLFSGDIPLCLSNLTSLRALDISHNNFSGNIPSPVITSLVHLEYLYLSGNHFDGSFSLNSVANHSKLQGFSLESLGGKLYIDTEDLDFSPSVQLRVLWLAGCNLNNETRKVPKFLLYQKELTILDLSSNNLVGKFPNWLLENNTGLEVLNLRGNSFTGPFLSNSTPILNHLWMLDISNNQVTGQVPQDTGLFFPSLEYLNLSTNYFEGSIPESLGSSTLALSLDLSHNNFSGEVPDRLATFLLNLILSYNNLRGYFPSNSTFLMDMEILRIDNNHFAGNISHGLSYDSTELYFLDISNNEFQGEIPRWIGNFSSLAILDLSGNQLEGTIPDDICRLSSLEFLDLSANCLNGPIPSCSGFPSLKYIHLQRNQITGAIPSALLKNSTSLKTLDLRYNHISSSIPHDIKTLTQLKVLLLGGNNLQGQITASICQLKDLSIMDLSRNNFSGSIPSCLSNISFGANFNHDSWNYEQGGAIGPVTYANSWGAATMNWLSIYFERHETVQFTTKDITNSYTGNILNYMSGIDLSHNQLTGQIPTELGVLSDIRALNLSHNYMQGSIPSELSMLNLIESLDLSYNNLSGQIPFELTNLNFLSKFNVSYNNLSGPTPSKGEFANFDERNYRGNPGLCGPLLQRQCQNITSTEDQAHDANGEDNDGAYYTIEFFLSFSVSFAIVLVTLALSLYLSPQYCRAWFSFIDTWILFRFYRRYKSRSK